MRKTLGMVVNNFKTGYGCNAFSKLGISVNKSSRSETACTSDQIQEYRLPLFTSTTPWRSSSLDKHFPLLVYGFLER